MENNKSNKKTAKKNNTASYKKTSKKYSKNAENIKSILDLIKPYGFLVWVSIFLAVINTAAALLIPIFTGKAIDYMIGKGNVDFYAVLSKIAIIAAIAVTSAAAQYFMALCNNKITFCICRDLREKVSEKFQNLPVSYFDSHPSGDIISRMINDIDTFSDGLLMGFTQLFTGIITIISIIGIMFYLNAVIALAVLLLTPISFFATKFIAGKTQKYFMSQAMIRGDETALINELVAGKTVLKVFGAENKSLKEFDKINDKLGKASLKAVFYSSLANPTTRLINNLVYAVIALIGAIFAVAGSITVGGLSIFLSYAGQYAKPFNEISGVVTEFQNAITCVQRVFYILNEKDQPKEEINKEYNFNSKNISGEVAFNNVNFGYSKDKPLIKDLNFKALAGQRIAIVGPTGCGKTTLINLLMRFYDVNSGNITVDGADINKISRKDLRSCYGMVLQDTWLCNGTIKENISYGVLNATDKEIVAAAKAAHAHSFIKRLPNGYETVITGNGESLSAGQRQLLCIARAMLKLPPMLILDEATSNIDTRTEMKIQDAFATMMKGRTSFIVAHRLSTVKEADVILVMKNGSVIEQGTHTELINKNGFYAKLYNSQFENQNI